jgi:hypothetical protein
LFTSACLIFLFVAFFVKDLSPDQRKIFNAIFSLLAGFATFFIGGTAFVRLTGDTSGIKFFFTGSAGVAVFVLVLFHPIFTNDPLTSAPLGGTGTLKAPGGDTSTRSDGEAGASTRPTTPSTGNSATATPSISSSQSVGVPTARFATFAVSGSFDNGYSIASDSTVTVDTITGSEISANIKVEGPDKKVDVFRNEAVYQKNTVWGWQGQGSLGGSLDLRDEDRTFVRYTGGVLTHSAYNTPSLGRIITSSDTTLKLISSSDTRH